MQNEVKKLETQEKVKCYFCGKKIALETAKQYFAAPMGLEGWWTYVCKKCEAKYD